MKHLSKCLSLVLAAALVLGLAACGKDTTGDDWRASGVVTDYGTIARDGERVPVCICLSTENAGFYYDKDEQVWFDGVEFPMALADALTAYRSTSFDDLDGDGQSDVTMIFDHGDGSTTELVWLWYDDTGFEFEPVLSSVTSGTPYFEANDLDMNARVDGGTYVLTDGVCSYHGTGDGYAVGDVYWEVTKTRDETHDGLREIEFDAYCYIPGRIRADVHDRIHLRDQQRAVRLLHRHVAHGIERLQQHRARETTTTSTPSRGTARPTRSSFSTPRAGKRPATGATYSPRATSFTCPRGMTVWSLPPSRSPTTTATRAKRDQLDSICPEADILNCATVDAHNCLFFRIG